MFSAIVTGFVMLAFGCSTAFVPRYEAAVEAYRPADSHLVVVSEPVNPVLLQDAQ